MLTGYLLGLLQGCCSYLNFGNFKKVHSFSNLFPIFSCFKIALAISFFLSFEYLIRMIFNDYYIG